MNSKFKPFKYEPPKSKFAGIKSLQRFIVFFAWIFFVISGIIFIAAIGNIENAETGMIAIICSFFIFIFFLLLLSINATIKLLINLTENSDRQKELLDSINNKIKASDIEG